MTQTLHAAEPPHSTDDACEDLQQRYATVLFRFEPKLIAAVSQTFSVAKAAASSTKARIQYVLSLVHTI